MPIGDRPESWPVAASTDVHRDGWVVALRSDMVQRPGTVDEPPFRRLVLEHPGAAIALALDEADRVLCLSQYRHPAQRRFIELPAGLLDVPGEDPRTVAARELLEEGGVRAADWTHLTTVWSSPGISAEVFHMFVARGLEEADRGDFVLEHEEADMETLWVPFDELHAAVLDGRVSDAPVALAVLACRARGLA